MPAAIPALITAAAAHYGAATVGAVIFGASTLGAAIVGGVIGAAAGQIASSAIPPNAPEQLA